MTLPTPYAPNRHDYRREVGRRVKNAKLALAGTPTSGGPTKSGRRCSTPGRGCTRSRTIPTCGHGSGPPAQADRVEREIDELESRVQRHNQSLAREFDGVLGVLSAFGYVDRVAWRLTEAGEMLARTFHESDLLVTAVSAARAARRPATPAELAGLVSTFVYEHRSPDDPPRPWFPSDDVKRRWRSIAAVSEDLAAIERSYGLGVHRPPEPTFIAVAYAWIAGDSFAEVVADEELTGGDFVRTMKQLIDLPRPDRDRGARSRDPPRREQAADAAFRDVVADRRVVAVDDAWSDDGVMTVTIRKGAEWGEPVARPDGLVVADFGRRAARRSLGGARPARWRWSSGRSASHARRTVRAGRRCTSSRSMCSSRRRRRGRACAVAHVVARRSWWRGRIVGGVQLRAPRALGCGAAWPPQRRLAEVVDVDPTMTLRQRVQAWRRLPSGTHVPHPRDRRLAAQRRELGLRAAADRSTSTAFGAAPSGGWQ